MFFVFIRIKLFWLLEKCSEIQSEIKIFKFIILMKIALIPIRYNPMHAKKTFLAAFKRSAIRDEQTRTIIVRVVIFVVTNQRAFFQL